MKKITLLLVLLLVPLSGTGDSPQFTYPSVSGLDLDMQRIFHDINQVTTSKVLQTVGGTGTSNGAVSSTGYVSTNVTVTIQPLMASSRILLQFSVVASIAATDIINLCLARNTILIPTAASSMAVARSPSATNTQFQMSAFYIDSPASTDSLTYTLYAKTSSGNSVNIGSGAIWSITAQEIQ